MDMQITGLPEYSLCIGNRGRVHLKSKEIFIGDIDENKGRPGRTLSKGEAIERVLSLEKPVAIYETRNGIRFILLDKKYAPNSGEVRRIFEQTFCDEEYVKFCLREERFSARLSPKGKIDSLFYGISRSSLHILGMEPDAEAFNFTILHDALSHKATLLPLLNKLNEKARNS